jgi:crotonobetaine/carnitine-CoA ligase
MTIHALDPSLLRARLSSPDACVLPTMLDRQADRFPDKTLIIFDDGPTWSYAETRDIARGTAAALMALGVKRGDRVLVWLNDGPDIVRVAFGLFYLGAICVPMNPEYRGSVLEHTISYAKADILIMDSAFLERLHDTRIERALTVVALGDAPPRPPPTVSVRILPASVLDPVERPLPDPMPALTPWDVHTIFFTSGTTGVPKGVESTHMHCATMAIDGLRFLEPEDRFVTPCGFFHVGGAYAPWGVINKGASMVVVGRFSASRFWDQVRRHKATTALMIGVMCDFLMRQPPMPDDAESPLRMAIIQPLPSDVGQFMTRFGIDVYTQYDQTETSPPLTSDLIDPARSYPPGFCGQVRPGFEARIVDENDMDVPTGAIGQLVLRCEVPWVIFERYFDMPEQTAKAWRNGWYHTGDMFRVDADGNHFFVDRSKDVIRRRGENISSFEIEHELAAYPGIKAAAAYGVESEFSESEVMVCLEPTDGALIDLKALNEALAGKLPKFMVPRYYRLVDALPRSATDKVTKPDLQAEGVTEDTWDSVMEATPRHPSRVAPIQARGT